MLEVKCPRQGPLFFSGGVNEQSTKMPVDFEAYLLSASPPGFDMYHHFSGAPGKLCFQSTVHPCALVHVGSNYDLEKKALMLGELKVAFVYALFKMLQKTASKYLFIVINFDISTGFGGLTNRLGIHQPKSIIVGGTGNETAVTRVSSAPQLQSFNESNLEVFILNMLRHACVKAVLTHALL